MIKLLKRQLKRLGISIDSGLSKDQLSDLLALVEQTYLDRESERKFFEHTIKTSSEELLELYQLLQDKSQKELEKSKSLYQHLATHDSLTGLSNRFLLNEISPTILHQAERDGIQIAFVYFDLDHFKDINDSLGHHIGDKLLQEVATRIGQQLRKNDLFVRLGGDEFLIVMNLSSIEQLHPFLHKLIQLFSLPWQIEGLSLSVTSSLGISIYPQNGDNVIDLLKNADIALYKAKDNGRNTFQIFTDTINMQAQEALLLQKEITQAIHDNQFEVYLQPQVDTSSLHILGAEALLRWNHPEKGFISPGVFIPIAEDTGLMCQLGDIVIQQSVKALQTLHSCYPDQHLTLSINVSIRQLQQNKLVDTIKKALQTYQVDPQYLHIEITESIMQVDHKSMLLQIQQLQSMGLKILIDDFGTGYSSILQLQHLPFNILKMDKTFIDLIGTSATTVPLVDAILSIAKGLNYQVIAEGVEHPYQQAYLSKKGCEQIQGFLFSPAVPLQAFLELVNETFAREGLEEK